MSHGHHHGGNHADMLALKAELFARHTASLAAWLPVTGRPCTIVDLGCGTGAGTFTLLTQFPDAAVVAVDSSPEHLQRVKQEADARGLLARIRIVQADLDDTWPDLGTPDLVWASESLHHLADPHRAVQRVYRALPPGGLFAVIELNGFARFLPPDAPEFCPGVEERCHAVNDRKQAKELPHRGADWESTLTTAGFEIADFQTVDIHVDVSDDPGVGRYALMGLRSLREAVADDASSADLAALDELLDPDSPRCILDRPDLAVRTRRLVWAARRP